MIKNIVLVMGLLSGFSFFSMQASDVGALDSATQATRIKTLAQQVQQFAHFNTSDEDFGTFVAQIFSADVKLLDIDSPCIEVPAVREICSLRQLLENRMNTLKSGADKITGDAAKKKNLEKMSGRYAQLCKMLPNESKSSSKTSANSPKNRFESNKLINFLSTRTLLITGSGIIALIGFMLWKKHSASKSKSPAANKTNSTKNHVK